jgi:hypothetical protein
MKENGLTRADYALLEARWIDQKTADGQRIRRVDSVTAATLLNRLTKEGFCSANRDYAGLALYNVFPGDTHCRTIRVRRDHPEENNGKVEAKYMGPPGEGNKLYFPAGSAQTNWRTLRFLPY